MGMMNPGKMMKQMEMMNKELAERKITASAGGGAVNVTVNGLNEVLEIKIDKDAVDVDDIEMLEDMILAAVNDALKQAQDMASGQLSKITGGLSIPGFNF